MSTYREYGMRIVSRKHLVRCLLAGITVLTCHHVVVAQSEDKMLNVVEEIWGFDGRVQPGQFNPVSILVDNRGEEAVDAVASLTETKGAFLESGGVYLQPVYIAPGGRRWIQFYPYLPSYYQSDWKLKLGSHTFPALKQARAVVDPTDKTAGQLPQAVIFDVPESLSRQPASIKHFPENIFPPYSTVTFGLHTAFMDHLPDWERPRQEAFMSWVKQGGQLHLLKNRRDEYPQFSGALAELSQPFDSFRVGRGTVTKHSIQRADLTEEIVRASVTSVDTGDEQAELDAAIEQQQNTQQYNSDVTMAPDVTDGDLFRNMRQITQPKHAWGLIFFLAIGYIGMIFPGCWIISQRKQVHYLVTYGAVAGLSIVFSLLFLFIGRRGYGESTTVHTLAIARMEDSTTANVFQWNALFATSGDTYRAIGNEQQTVFSTGDADQNVNAGMTSGNKGELSMRIPPFSTQTFLSRRRVTVPDNEFQLQELDYERNRLTKLTIASGKEFQPDEDTVIRLIAGSNVYRLRYDEDSSSIRLVGAVSRLTQFCRNRIQSQMFGGAFMGQQNDDRTAEQRFYEDALPEVVRRSLIDDLVYDPKEFELSADRVRLLIYKPIDEEMQVPIDVEARLSGRILYVYDLFADDIAVRADNPE